MSRIHRESRAWERDVVKARMRERLGMTESEFAELQRKRRLQFLIFQRFYPKAFSGTRFLLRKLTGDVLRKRLARFFYEEWIIPPRDVVDRLGKEFCDASTS